MKAQRQALLLGLIADGRVGSQQQAVALLKKMGVHATQATVSRDLEEIGAVKVKSAGAVTYTVAAQNSRFGASLPQVLRDYVIRKQSSGNMIVLHTPPGHASMVAAAIDREGLPGVLGVVAGDDTLFLCIEEKRSAKRLLEEIEALAMLSNVG